MHKLRDTRVLRSTLVPIKYRISELDARQQAQQKWHATLCKTLYKMLQVAVHDPYMQG